jgi:glycosyltransferase involved in cell wall biosynthesis
MKLAYLLNSYPMTSTTFVRREIEALETLGQPVLRFGVRHWEVPLVEPEDIAEQGRTEYLLTGRVLALLTGALTEPFVNLPRLIRTLPLWRQIRRAGGGGLVRPIGYLLQAIRFRRRARALRVDHVHVHFSTNPATVAMLARSLGGPSFSFTVHGPDELVDPASNALGLKTEKSEFVAAITEYCRSRILAEAPGQGDKIRIIPCGIDLDEFAPTPPLTDAGMRIVCVGRLCANKAQVLIPPAIALIRDEFPDLLIELIGDGDDRPQIEAEARRLGVEANIRLLGWMPNDAVRAHIRDSAALLLPSFAEGLPIVIMEALAMERPVLTTIIAGIPELVDEGCGWIFPPGEVDRIAEALRAVLAMPAEQRLALGKEGRRRIEERHDIMLSARKLLEAFAAISPASPK